MVTDSEFCSLMAGVCAPVTVVTTADEDGPAGATVSSFASLSLHPPLVSVAFDRGSHLLARIQRAGRFGVNILAHGQEDLAVVFARRDVDRFSSARWRPDHGLPRFPVAAGWAVCELYNDVEAGDHRLTRSQSITRDPRAASRANGPPFVAELSECRRVHGPHHEERGS